MTWLLILGMTLITFFNRFAFFSEGLKYQPSIKMRRFLSYSSHAVLTSIWVPIIFQFSVDDGLSIVSLDYLIAASVAAILCILDVRSILVVLISTTSFFLLRFFLF